MCLEKIEKIFDDDNTTEGVGFVTRTSKGRSPFFNTINPDFELLYPCAQVDLVVVATRGTITGYPKGDVTRNSLNYPQGFHVYEKLEPARKYGEIIFDSFSLHHLKRFPVLAHQLWKVKYTGLRAIGMEKDKKVFVVAKIQYLERMK